MTRLVSITAGGEREPWHRLGLAPEGGSFLFGGVAVHVSPERPAGLHGWSFSTCLAGDLDGIPTEASDPGPVGGEVAPVLGGRLLAVDHVVVTTDDLDRTSRAVEAHLGAPLRRTRDAGGGTVQGFHRIENTVIELVSSPSSPLSPKGASLWGFVGVVDDLDAVWRALTREFGAEAVSGPRDAVQAGRRICSLRRSVGLGVALALMDARPSSVPGGK